MDPRVLKQTDFDDVPIAEVQAPKPGRHTRKLFDKLLMSFHHACDLGDYEVAGQILPILEVMTTRKERTEDNQRRRNIEGLVAAHERLWHLRHPLVE